MIQAIGKLIRQILLVLGGAGLAGGWLDETRADEIGGAIAVLLAAGWSWWTWFKARKQQAK